MLKDPKNYPLSVHSRTQKITLWAYAQSLCERTLNRCVSVRSIAVWAYTQGPKKWPFERKLKDPKNDPLGVRSIAVWAYAQSPFERTLKDPKNDPLSVRSRAHFGWTFLPHIFTVNYLPVIDRQELQSPLFVSAMMWGLLSQLLLSRLFLASSINNISFPPRSSVIRNPECC